MASVFCEHRRVKTTCPECKLLLVPPRPAQPEPPTGRAPGPSAEPAGPEASAEVRGPGKPLLPQRKRVRRATAEEAENADAWWVKRS